MLLADSAYVRESSVHALHIFCGLPALLEEVVHAYNRLSLSLRKYCTNQSEEDDTK